MSSETRLVIFDFDGVLADTEDLHCEAFLDVLREEGAAFSREDYYQRYLGLPDAACLASALAARGRASDEARVEALVQRKRAAYALRAPRARLYPGAAELVRRLHRRHLLAIASGAFREEITTVLERGEVGDRFAAIVAAEDVARGKPAPDPFLRALAEVNRARDTPLAAAQCLVVEDAPHGIDAAHAAGMRCVAVATNHGRASLAHADAVLGELREIEELLA